MKHYISFTASIEGPNSVSASANSDGVHVVFYNGTDGLAGAVCINLDDAAARAALIQLTAAVAARGGK